MNFIKLNILILLLVAHAYDLHAQTDSIEVLNLNQKGIASAQDKNGWMVAMSYHADAYKLANKIGFKNGKADALHHLAILEAKAADRKDKALEYFLEELQIRETLNDKATLSDAYETVGDFFKFELQDVSGAVGYYRQALLLRKNLGGSDNLIEKNLFKIANAYNHLEQITDALFYFNQIVELYAKNQKFEKAANLCFEIAKIYTQQKNFTQAIAFTEKAQTYHKASNGKDLSKQFEMSISALKKLEEDEKAIQFKWQLLIYLGISLPFLIGLGFWWFRKKKSK